MRKKTPILLFFFIINFAFLVQATRTAKTQNKVEKQGSKLAEVQGIDRPFWTPNRIGNYITNNGQLVSHIPTGSGGMKWPVGSSISINFASGVWLAGIKEGEIVTAAAEFISEFQPGNVTGHAPGLAGTPADPEDSRFKVYIINQGDEFEPFRNQDYLNWPVEHGAPVDENGKPLLLGTSTAWAVFNDFDESLHNNFFQSNPMGVEVQMTAWAFDRPDAFGNMMFFKFLFINKSGKDMTDSYVAFWADIDIDDALDLVGCDTTLSLGYMYKTQPSPGYGNNPPAIGYDFFQGPIVSSPGDTANVSGRKVPDFKNVGMTSFAKYIGAGPPLLSDPEYGPEAYNFMTGLNPFGGPIIDEFTGEVTKFWNPGDPVTEEGWLDVGHDDRRFLMSSGPFTLADGDTQEVVAGIVIARGETGRESVTLLKRNSQIAQRSYDSNFALPPVPTNPIVTMHSDPESIFLTWDEAAENYAVIDPIDIDSLGNASEYTFQGYNVYQLDSQMLSPETTVKKIAAFDIIDGVIEIRDDVFLPERGQTVNLIVQDAQDTGLQRYLRISEDRLQENIPLIQNRSYYFAVTAYGYNPLGIPRTLESPIQPHEVRPQSPSLGTDLSTLPVTLGDTLAVTHNSGVSSGGIVPVVLQPGALTGHTYEVRFRKLIAAPDSGTIVYDVVDVTTGELKAEGFKNQSNEEGAKDYPVVDGVLVKVNGAPDGFKSFQMVANGAGPLVPSIGAASDFRGFPGSVPRANAEQQVGTGQWFFGVGGGANDGTYEGFLSRSLRGSNFSRVISFDWEMRFTARGSWALRRFEGFELVKVPFELWNIGSNTPDDPSDDYRCIPWFLSNGGRGDLQTDPDGMTYQLDPNDSGASGGTNDPYTPWIYWEIPADTSPGEAGYNAYVSAIDTTLAGMVGVDAGGTFDIATASEAFAKTILVSFNGDDVSDGEVAAGTQLHPEEGSIIRIITTKPNTPSDVFSFESVAPKTGDLKLARQQAARLVNVFPNPYYRNIVDLNNPFAQFVTFTHLPEEEAAIHIFTIYGDLVRKIRHTNGTQFEEWDLRNSDGRAVASGIYIVRIDMGEIGVKVLKLGVL